MQTVMQPKINIPFSDKSIWIKLTLTRAWGAARSRVTSIWRRETELQRERPKRRNHVTNRENEEGGAENRFPGWSWRLSLTCWRRCPRSARRRQLPSARSANSWRTKLYNFLKFAAGGVLIKKRPTPSIYFAWFRMGHSRERQLQGVIWGAIWGAWGFARFEMSGRRTGPIKKFTSF